MKFTVKNVGFLKGLAPVIGVAEAGVKKEYPDAYKVSLMPKKDQLFASAHNGNVAITNILKDQNNLDYSGESEGEVTVNSKDLSATLASFDNDEFLDVEVKTNELIFVPKSDPEKIQTIPAEVRSIEMPKVATTFDKEISVNKASFVEAANKVMYAIGFELFKPQFLYWKMIVEPKKLRIVCGDGGRFPIYDVEGDNIVDTTGSSTFLIYKEQNPALFKVLSTVDADKISIKEYIRQNDTDTISNQFIIEIGSATVILVGHDSGIVWPDESLFTERKNSYKFVSKLSDWNKELAGVWATYNEDVRNQNATHVTSLTFDTKKGYITLKSENSMKSLRKVKLLDSLMPSGEEVLEFKVQTPVLRDALKQSDGYVQMELLTNMKPMVMRYFAGEKVEDGALNRVNQAAGTKEQYLIAFGSYNKK